jgi:hypothetical protein
MGDRFRIGRRGPMEPSEDLDFTTSLHDGWVVAFLLTCAPLGRAVVNFGDDESSDLTSNIVYYSPKGILLVYAFRLSSLIYFSLFAVSMNASPFTLQSPSSRKPLFETRLFDMDSCPCRHSLACVMTISLTLLLSPNCDWVLLFSISSNNPTDSIRVSRLVHESINQSWISDASEYELYW